MKVLNKSADKFIGFHVDSDMDVFLTLLSIIEGIGKSPLLRGMVGKSIGRRDLHYEVAEQLSRTFYTWKGGTRPKALELFTKSIKESLLRKKIPPKDIERVLKEFNALTVKE